jgi:hypothetical protein
VEIGGSAPDCEISHWGRFKPKFKNISISMLRPFAALWAISKWAKSEIAQSESVGYFFHCALLSCAAGMGYFLWAIPACALFK